MKVDVSFNEELGFFFPPRDRVKLHVPKSVTFQGKRQVIDFIQSCGVPHTEVGEVLVNGKPVGFDFILQDSDSIRAGFIRYTEPVSNPRFLCDVHLWKMARRLRLLGFDTRFDRSR